LELGEQSWKQEYFPIYQMMTMVMKKHLSSLNFKPALRLETGI